ncbi:unnamed protein product [Leptidea sinapis]|uniref:Uncharacterized protein n=1 Tax=Leptidea sinapis TaxID=189913 RepID=A0A5E4R4F5_9NEOP|nr:unnamed protein product [Leptidea sinapis]
MAHAKIEYHFGVGGLPPAVSRVLAPGWGPGACCAGGSECVRRGQSAAGMCFRSVVVSRGRHAARISCVSRLKCDEL